MPTVGPEHQEAALPFRVYGLEGRADTVDAALTGLTETTARHSEAISAQAVTLARHDEQLGGTNATVVEVKTDVAQLATSVSQLAEKVASVGNRVAWTLTAATLTVLGAMLADKL